MTTEEQKIACLQSLERSCAYQHLYELLAGFSMVYDGTESWSTNKVIVQNQPAYLVEEAINLFYDYDQFLRFQYNLRPTLTHRERARYLHHQRGWRVWISNRDILGYEWDVSEHRDTIKLRITLDFRLPD